MSWAHPIILALIPVALIAAVWLVRGAQPGDGSGFVHIARRWVDRRGISARRASSRRRLARGLAGAAGAALVLLALARPQWGEIAEQTYDQSREVMLALDLSRSMLADDVAPNRLARAKLLIGALLDQLRGERVGLVVFAGTAFVQSPLSADYEVLRDFLAELDPSYLPQGGSDYEAMLRTARQAFGQQGAGDRYLVVLSDGEALDEHWQSLVPDLRDAGIRVVGLGVGTPQGALVPDGNGGLVKDEHGAAVLSRLEPQTLQQLAEQTGGAYRDAATWVDIAEVVDATVAQGRQGRYVEQRGVRLQDRYQWFLAPGLLLWLLAYWLELPLSPLARALPKRGRRSHPASAPVIASALLVLVAWETHSRQAYAAVPDDTPPQSGTVVQPNSLAKTVAELSDKPALGGRDYARLAADTVTFASQPNSPADATRTGIVDDALAAVDRGEAADPKAADWPALRAALEKLKEAKPPQPEERKQDEQKQNQGEQKAEQNGSPQADAKGGGAGQQDETQNENPGSAGGSPAAQDGSEKREQGSGQNDGSNTQQKEQSGNAGTDGDEANDTAGGQQHSSPPSAGEPPALPGSDHPSGQAQASAPGKSPERDANVQPLAAPEAGLAGDDQQKPADEKAAAAGDAKEPQQPQQPARMVGGGRAMPGADRESGNGALAALEQLKDGDAPAVLFDRMNRAEGQPRLQQYEKNW